MSRSSSCASSNQVLVPCRAHQRGPAVGDCGWGMHACWSDFSSWRRSSQRWTPAQTSLRQRLMNCTATSSPLRATCSDLRYCCPSHMVDSVCGSGQVWNESDRQSLILSKHFAWSREKLWVLPLEQILLQSCRSFFFGMHLVTCPSDASPDWCSLHQHCFASQHTELVLRNDCDLCRRPIQSLRLPMEISL